MSERFTSRPPWRSAPIGLRTAVERRLGHTVAAAGEVHGGMSPGPAAVLSLANGHDVFVKAVSRTANAGSHQLYQQEAAALAALPADAPAARLIETVETGHWIAIITELAPGQVAGPPWTNASIHAVA